jgi:hypothetical protein
VRLRDAVIDGVPVSGFDSSVTAAISESVTFTGLAGVHNTVLPYANTEGKRSDGASLRSFLICTRAAL